MNDNIDEIRSKLLTTAILGTDRSPLDLPQIGGVLGTSIAKINKDDPQQFLQSVLVLTEYYYRAGKLPILNPDNLDVPSQIDNMPCCSQVAASHLRMMLNGQYKELIPEWLTLATKKQKRVSEELLPDLLQYAENNPDFIETVLRIIGNRGKWLVMRMPALDKCKTAIRVEALPSDEIENFWQTETLYARNALLQKIRKSDPARALELINTTWTEDNAEERKTFIASLSIGLSMDDEPFLENILDDRSIEVRRAAVELLSCLPNSRLVQRQIERIQPYIHWKAGKFLYKGQLTLSYPETLTKDMERDGIHKQIILKRQGEKANWLYQILRCIPPSYWSEKFQQTPHELMEIAGRDEWRQIFHESWLDATIHTKDAEWAKAIQLIYTRKKPLLQFLPEQEREAFLLQEFKSNNRTATEMITLFTEQWSKELTKSALQELRKYIPLLSKPGTYYVMPDAVLKRITLYMEPETAIDIFSKFAKDAEPNSPWEKQIDAALQLLDFRKRMMEEFN